MEILAGFAIAAVITLVIAVLASNETVVAAPEPRLLDAPAEPRFPDALTAFRAMIVRWNAGDADGAAECFGERAIFRGNPLLPDGGCLGQDSIRAFLSHSIATNIHCSVTEGRSSVSGSGGRLEVRSDRIARRGIERLFFSYYAEVRDGEIALLHLTADINDDDTAEYVEYVRSLRMRGDEPPDHLLRIDDPSDAVEIVEGEIVGEFTEIVGEFPPPVQRFAATTPSPFLQSRVAIIAGASAMVVALLWMALRRRRKVASILIEPDEPPADDA